MVVTKTGKGGHTTGKDGHRTGKGCLQKQVQGQTVRHQLLEYMCATVFIVHLLYYINCVL